MIYTVTLNPSVDLHVELDQLKLQHVNRSREERKFPGGKGINVSRVLHRIGIETTAFGFVGGFTGAFIRDYLLNEGVRVDFVDVGSDSRINIKLRSSHQKETEINGMGPKLTNEHYRQFLSKLETVKTGEFLVLAGNIPASLPADLYVELTRKFHAQGVRVVVDTSSQSLLQIVKNRPFLIKPNHHELGDLFGISLQSVQEIIPYAKRLVRMGAQHVIVSMAEQGALLVTESATYLATVPTGQVISSVGAGDSLVAGFIGTFSKTGDLLKAFQYGIAAGSATAFSTDLCTYDSIKPLLSQVTIREL
jgi:1-phosphofructokinase